MVERGRPRRFDAAKACVDAAIEQVGKQIVLGLPLGLGKAPEVANAFFARAQADPSLSLHIITALTLEPPCPSGELSRRFLQPLLETEYAQYPALAYARARRRGELPANVQVSEFYFSPGEFLHHPEAQQHYLSSNYTQVVRDLIDRGVNVVAQMVAPAPDSQGQNSRLSLSCNTDVTLELVEALGSARRHELLLIGEINRQLPFLANDAEVDSSFFDFLLAGGDSPLFAVPLTPVSLTDYAIGLQVSSLIKDGGTLQIGIGSLADAVTHMLLLRQQHNDQYRALLETLLPPALQSLRAALPVEQTCFEKGLNASSEMLVEGLLDLHRAGILKRRVYADEALQSLLDKGDITEAVTPQTLQALIDCGRLRNPLTAVDLAFLQRFGIVDEGVRWVEGDLQLATGQRVSARLSDKQTFAALCEFALGQRLRGGFYLQAGFYLGSQMFYRKLQQLGDDARAGINMTGIGFINALYGQEKLKRLQRRQARFINSAMMVTLTGAVVSDGLDNNRVVSGVGGQYDFVAQAQALSGARSIICLPSTRWLGGRVQSNIVWQYPHTTIPRHLRDIVVTEYGAADLRGKSDAEVISAMLAVCDSRFQKTLLKQARQAGKIGQDYEIPAAFRNNTPRRLQAVLGKAPHRSCFAHFPLGTGFSTVEAELVLALDYLKGRAGNKKHLLAILLKGIWHRLWRRHAFSPHLQRLGLERPGSLRERLHKWVISGALAHALRAQRPLTRETGDSTACA